MKKYFIVILCTLLIFVFGFSFEQPTNIIDNTKYSHAVLNDGTKVTETFAINFANIEGVNDIVKTMLTVKLQNELSNIIVEISQKISNEKDEEIRKSIDKQVLGIVEENENILCLKITYSNLYAWKYFSNSGQNTEVVKRFYTYDYYDQKGKVGGKTNLSGEEILIGEYLQDKIFIMLDDLIPSWRGDNMASYTYITSLRRRHSSANSIAKYNGMYYHQWLLDENPDISFWTTRPILVTWYVTALVVSMAVLIIVYLIGKNKENKKITENEQSLEGETPSKPLLYIKIDNEEEKK